MLKTGEEIAQQRVDLTGEGFENRGPVERSKAIGKRLCAIDIIDVGEDVVDLGVADAVFGEFDREPLMGIEIDLDHHREPGLNLDVNETEPRVHEVEIQEQTLAPGGLHERPTSLEAKRECPTRLEGAEDTHQTLLYPIPRGHFPSLCGAGEQECAHLVGLDGP